VREGRSDGSYERTNYDPAGNRTDRCYWSTGPDEACLSVDDAEFFTNPPTRHSTTGYDALNQRIELIDGATRAITEYDPNHNYQVSAVYVPTGPGMEHHSLYGYDERHRLATVTHRLCTLSDNKHNCTSTSPTGSNSYTYDHNDNRTQVVEDNGAASTDRRYCYDAQDRLTYRNTAANYDPATNDESYVYDPAGNRTQSTAGTTTTFTYNSSGQLTGCSPHCGVATHTSVAYDDAGRTLSWNGWHLGYDGEGRLAKACKDSSCAASGERVYFTYDGDGRRTRIDTAPASGSLTSVEFRYRGESIVDERDGSGNLLRSYLVDEAGTILQLVIASGDNVGTYLVTWNGHGDALALYRIESDGSLELANSYTYSTWGAPTIDGSHENSANSNAPYGDLGFRFLYVGQFGVQWDDFFGLGLHYMQARHYAPALGRFIQPDPSRLEENHYAYAENNPISGVDPSGTIVIAIPIALGIGALLSTAKVMVFVGGVGTAAWLLAGTAHHVQREYRNPAPVTRSVPVPLATPYRDCAGCAHARKPRVEPRPIPFNVQPRAFPQRAGEPGKDPFIRCSKGMKRKLVCVAVGGTIVVGTLRLLYDDRTRRQR
jgi:RHS repeat-associated protein